MPHAGSGQATARPTAGRVVVAPFDAAARRAADECVSLLVAAGHLAVRAESPLAMVEELPLSDQEVAVVVLTPEEGQRLAEPGEAGRRLLESLGRNRESVLTVLCGIPDGPASRAAIRAGAWTTADGPKPPGPLLLAIDRALRVSRALQREARPDMDSVDLERLIGEGGAGGEIAPAERLVRRAAESGAPVLIVGEPGSGKHLVARAIHARARGRRRAGPFLKLPIDALSGLPPAAIREEICGTFARPGPLELADGGTLFLDDIARLPIELQALLIELLDEGAAARVPLADGSGSFVTDVRLIAGAPEDLEEARRRGSLREDLFYRLRVLPIRLRPLRDRPADLMPLADALLRSLASRRPSPGRAILGFTPRAMALLQSHAWPGNLRELEDHLRRAVRRADGPVLDESDLPELASLAAGRPRRPTLGSIEVMLALDETLPLIEGGRRAASVAEIALIRRALKACAGNITHAARLLRVSRIHLQKRMKRYGLRATP